MHCFPLLIKMISTTCTVFIITFIIVSSFHLCIPRPQPRLPCACSQCP
jgi:hypothetical protein